MLIDVTDQELAHILVGLRLLQMDISDGNEDLKREDLRREYPEHFTDVEMLVPARLDDLCEELNRPGEEIYLVWDSDKCEVLEVHNRRVDAVAFAEQFDNLTVRAFLTGKCASDGDD